MSLVGVESSLFSNVGNFKHYYLLFTTNDCGGLVSLALNGSAEVSFLPTSRYEPVNVSCIPLTFSSRPCLKYYALNSGETRSPNLPS